ncbi:LuxR C-terminal-related transcriptional regulator [Pedobacter cryoconitis]|uniref:DNA-binding CsgD family transcriptional regulator n=1 Tax=Pedobacter cryoconitis TaxID=188932 RepID=A0A7X0J4G1_9SPHI|nr:LuxR C-terminal-related transcriptional regulator [Pedobacter cryoconitis]MBB6500875.1 DNA-binding CsgD family transcriptional regulator [Pedobacter cryoconitis]
MESNNNVMKATWDRYSDFYTRSNIALPKVNLDQFLPSFICPGQFYYYVVGFYDRQIKYMDPSVVEILGLEPESATAEKILDRIHPDDINYVTQTESASLKFMFDKVGRDSVRSYYKTTYCLRLKVADGGYELFHNQSILLSNDDTGRITQVLHIHTNVSHITTVNNYMPSLVGIKGEKKVWPININRESENHALNLQFSKRETEIIKLIALGYKSEEIADSLFISVHTVHTHRKNITRKSGVKTSSELISLCVKDGLI